MKLQPLLSLGLMAAGAAAAMGPLQRRAAWDRANRTVYLALDYDDVAEAAARAGQTLPDLLHALWHAGATHLTLPEDTLARLTAQGRIGTVIPRQPLQELAPSGRWSYLAAHEEGLLDRLQAEMAARQPALDARLADDEGRSLLAVSGDLQALQSIGLGFDPELAHQAGHAGLTPLPRPTSYPWPTVATIDRSLAQAAALARSEHGGPAIVAFQGTGTPGHPGELILGHEMLIQDTIASLKHHGLAFAYFVESRHQRGDWFVAKSLAPNVVLAHQFNQAQLVPEDMYTAAHRWGLLAREKGIRLALLNLFKVVHATTALDCVDYVAAVADVLVNREGMRLHGRPDFRPPQLHHHHGHEHDHGQGESPHRHPGDQHGDHHDNHEENELELEHDHEHGHEHEQNHEPVHEHNHEQGHNQTHEPRHAIESLGNSASTTDNSQFPIPNSQFSPPPLPRSDSALPWLALIPAGAGALAVSELLDLPDELAVPLTLAGLAAPLLVKRLDRPANALEATFRPSYAPKLIALGTTALAPLAAALVGYRGGLVGLMEAVAVEGLAAAGLAAVVADQDYTLRIEEVKTYQLEWIVPLAGALAVALAPAVNGAVNRQSLPAQIQISVAPARNGKPDNRLAQPAVLATVPALDQDSSWTRHLVMNMAETALTAAIDQGSTLLRKRMPGVTGSAVAWAFNQGGSLARRRLLPQAAAVLTSLEMRRPAQAPRDEDETHVQTEQLLDSARPAFDKVALVTSAQKLLPVGRDNRVVAWRIGLMAAAVGAGLVLTKSGLLPADPLSPFDAEHKTEHTHHLSRAQAAIGDASMALSLQPLRKWTVPTVATQTIAAFAPGPIAGLPTVAAALGEAAFLAGFRQAARPVERTVVDRLSLPRRR